ncbi:hypothetical protein SAMN05216327_115115 [Dyadobacter sp. SG02]|uniref:hypothetical protein n=1 Tax=Dyadobacter sp. SG02 TaxID=1855291 RepID=UPI0008AC90C5|nr:hypothetical protein [Dyadobacter sp. SG02]SEJ66077.1 hypothetical protein SAMN05216327_115115 [Dyadobacter sp. SG02]
MKQRGISKAVFGFTTVAAVIAGYFLGKKEKDGEKDVLSKNPHKSFAGREQIIELEIARGYHCAFLKHLDWLKAKKDLAEYEKFVELLRHPIDIDNAKGDFKKIFKQSKIAGLRMYPGLKGDIFTPIFIGTKSDLSDLIEVTVDGKETALVQDNNRPCNPCRYGTFDKKLPCKDPAPHS